MKLLILSYSLVISPNSGNIYGRQMIWESTRQILSATLSASSLSVRTHWFVDLNLQSQTCSFDFLQLFRQLLSARRQLWTSKPQTGDTHTSGSCQKKLVIFWILHSSVKEATGKTTKQLKYAHFTPDFWALTFEALQICLSTGTQIDIVFHNSSHTFANNTAAIIRCLHQWSATCLEQRFSNLFCK